MYFPNVTIQWISPIVDERSSAQVLDPVKVTGRVRVSYEGCEGELEYGGVLPARHEPGPGVAVEVAGVQVGQQVAVNETKKCVSAKKRIVLVITARSRRLHRNSPTARGRARRPRPPAWRTSALRPGRCQRCRRRTACPRRRRGKRRGGL